MSTDRKLQIAPALLLFWMSFSYWGQNLPILIKWNDSFEKIWISYGLIENFPQICIILFLMSPLNKGVFSR